MKPIHLEGVITVSLKETYKKIFGTDEEIVFVPFLNYHRINYEIDLEVFTVVDANNPLYDGIPDDMQEYNVVDLLMTYSAISHLLIELRNHFKGYNEFDDSFSQIHQNIIECLDLVDDIFETENQ